MKRLVAFFEIPAADFGRAVKFYETILGVTLAVCECESEKMAFFPNEDGRAPGAISFADGFKPASGGVLVSLHVEDLEAALEKVKSNGGEVIMPKTKIEADCLGYFAVFKDSEGNSVGLYADA